MTGDWSASASAAAVLHDLEELLSGPLALLCRSLPHLRSTELGMPEGQAVEPCAQDILRSSLAVLAEEKSRWIDNVGMAPTVGDDAGNVAPVIKSVVAKQLRELLTHRRLDLRVAHVEQLH